MPHPGRVLRQFWSDLKLVLASKRFWMGAVGLLLFLLCLVWFQSSDLIESLQGEQHFRRMVQSESYGLLSTTWWGIFEISAFVGMFLGTMSIAPDRGTNRLRYLLLQPITRQEFYLARTLRALVLTLSLLFAGTILTFLFLQLRLGFGPMVSEDFTGYVHHQRGALLRAYLRLLVLVIPPVCASMGLGVFLSSFLRKGMEAITVGFFLYVVLRLIGGYPSGVIEQYFFMGNLHLIGSWLREIGGAVSGTLSNVQKVSVFSPVVISSLLAFVGLIGMGDYIFSRKDLR